MRMQDVYGFQLDENYFKKLNSGEEYLDEGWKTAVGSAVGAAALGASAFLGGRASANNQHNQAESEYPSQGIVQTEEDDYYENSADKLKQFYKGMFKIPSANGRIGGIEVCNINNCDESEWKRINSIYPFGTTTMFVGNPYWLTLPEKPYKLLVAAVVRGQPCIFVINDSGMVEKEYNNIGQILKYQVRMLLGHDAENPDEDIMAAYKDKVASLCDWAESFKNINGMNKISSGSDRNFNFIRVMTREQEQASNARRTSFGMSKAW